jgi:hypothetical protein
VIVKTEKGHQVRSEDGKNLSADNLTREEAETRLAQVEMFKKRDAKAKRVRTWGKKNR